MSDVNILEGIKASIQGVSTINTYQQRLIIYFLITSFFTNLPVFSSSLYFMNPVFQCGNGEAKISENDACNMLSSCTIINTETITAELSLFCGSRKDDRVFLQTAFGYGCWLGLAAVSLLGDRIGRKLCFMIGILAINATWLCQLLGVYFESVWLLFIADFINGCSNRMIYINFLMILTRFLNKNAFERETLSFLIVCHGITQMAIAGINQIFKSWRAIVYLYSVGIFFCSIASFFFLKEDPIFLFDSGQVEKAKKVIEEIGEQNNEDPIKIKENADKLDYFVEVNKYNAEHNLGNQNIFDLRELVRYDIIVNVFVVALAGFFFVLSTKSIELSIQNLDYSYNFNLFIVGFSNVCGFTTAIYIIKIQQQRKRGLIYTIVIYCLISLLFLFPFCTQNGVVESFVIFFLRFFLCWHLSFYTRLKVDPFPQKYQSTIIGAIDVLINFGMVVGPHLVQISVDHHIIPILFISALRITVGTLPIFLFDERKIELHPIKTIKDQQISHEQRHPQ